jgi:hypothetical protein
MRLHRVSMVAAILALSYAGLATERPVHVNAPPVCFRCGREITKVRLAAEIIAPQGVVQKFRTPLCMAQYLAGAEHLDRPVSYAIYVTDWPTGRLVRAERAYFVQGTIDYRTRERDFFAFRSPDEALKFADQRVSSVVDWLAIRRLAATAATD